MTDALIVDVQDTTLVITINRPQARNAVDLALAQAMSEAFAELDRRDDLRVGVLTGAGGNFSSGMDLKAFLRGERPLIPGKGFAGLNENPPAKPLVAAVEGYALAGGFEMVLACDLIVAADNAHFGLPEAKRGLVAGSGGMLRLPHRLPHHIAMECLLTGEPLTAKRAYDLGLVNRLVTPGEALAEALDLARAVAANGPLSLVTTKRVVRESPDWPVAEMFDRQREITAPVFTSADAREGAAAFAEKRKPVWQGR